jgi:hypothetical protein
MENIKEELNSVIHERKLVNNLDIGIGENDMDNLIEKINIPYPYLDEEVRGNIDNIFTEFIKPSLQDALRGDKDTEILQESIKEASDKIIPGSLAIDVFLRNLKSIYVDKINIQNNISAFLTETVGDGELLSQKRDEITKRGIQLYDSSLQIEPLYFAYSSKIKEFADYCNKIYFEKASITPDENLMLLTPSRPCYPIKREIDFSRYRICEKEDRPEFEQELIKLYFNNEPLCFHKYMKKVMKRQSDFFTDDPGERGEIEVFISKNTGNLQSFYFKKLYFLLERKIPYAKEVDELLVIDNCFDKYLESKLCFLHDLFLKIYLIKWKEGQYGFKVDKKNLKEMIRMALNFDDQKLVNQLSGGDNQQ